MITHYLELYGWSWIEDYSFNLFSSLNKAHQNVYFWSADKYFLNSCIHSERHFFVLLVLLGRPEDKLS